jgi:hypothetical protein
MITKEMGYRSFLLRLWYFKQNGELAWRTSLEDPSTGQKYFFSGSDAINEFLQQLTQDLKSEMDK